MASAHRVQATTPGHQCGRRSREAGITGHGRRRMQALGFPAKVTSLVGHSSVWPPSVSAALRTADHPNPWQPRSVIIGRYTQRERTAPQWSSGNNSVELAGG